MKFEANTKTLFKVLSTSDTNTDITKGNTYDIYSDVDNEWYIIDDKGDKRYTFFVDNDIKEFYYDAFEYDGLDDLLVNTENGNIELSENNNTSKIDSFLVYEIEETINSIKRQVDLLEIFVNNLSIEPINPDELGEHHTCQDCCEDGNDCIYCGDLWMQI